MNSEQILDTLDQYFGAYPDEQIIHLSSDGQVFLQANYNDGVNHQRSLNPSIKLLSVSRKEWEKIALGQEDEEEDLDLNEDHLDLDKEDDLDLDKEDDLDLGKKIESETGKEQADGLELNHGVVDEAINNVNSEEPAAEEPAAEEPAVEEPAAEESAVEETAIEEPAAEPETKVEKPASKKTSKKSTRK
jgi:hypothetical protein